MVCARAGIHMIISVALVTYIVTVMVMVSRDLTLKYWSKQSATSNDSLWLSFVVFQLRSCNTSV